MSHCLSLLDQVRKGALHRRHIDRAARLLTTLLIALSLLAGSITPMQAATTITFTAEELLGKPTDTSITINIIPASTIEYHYQYGTAPGEYTGQTADATATGGQPHEVVISGLTANTRYYYRMRYHLPGETDWVERAEHSFWTQRAQNTTFEFTVTADIHNNIGTNYATAMTSINNDPPDFHVDIGDTFMVDSSATQTTINNSYMTHRGPQYFGRIGSSVPIFLSSGNHENEEGWNLDDSPFSTGVGNIQARKAFFPTPIDEGTGGFYSGNTDPLARIDEVTYGDELRENYYAWTWGDALFVVIDPFQYTMDLPYYPAAGEGSDDSVTGDQWSWTLGAQQYSWLKETLENSDAKYKFMFSHNMLGGIPRDIVGVDAGYVRGGAEAAAYFEWGGRNYDGTEGFADHRDPDDFPYTIHQLMVDNGVSAYFHGHDHQYAYERRDDVVYQEVPSPTMTGSGFSGIYTVGTYPEYETIAMCPGAGYLRITVAPDVATVDYVRTAGTGTCTPSSFPLSYTIEPSYSGPTHVLTTAVDPAEGGTISPAAGTHTYPQGQTVEVTATPNQWYEFDHWSGACTGDGTCSVTMDADKSVTAHFVAIPTHSLTMAVDPTGGGTTNPAVGVHTYEEGSVVNVTASPNTGYEFDHWSGSCTGGGTCSVTMDTDRSVTAHFAQITHDLTVAVNPAGGGTTNPTEGVHSYPYGTVVNLTATPNTGYGFTFWSGDCAGGTCSVTMTADRSVTANFAAVAGNVASAATPSDDTLTTGESVVVTINVDMSEVEAPYDVLGSFTASLAWNPAVLAFDSYSGPLAGFTGAVNTANVGSGQIVFNGANFNGATGNIVTFQVTLHAIGAGTSDLDLEYSAIAALADFANLLPLLIISDGQVTVSPGTLGDINGDGDVNSSDALLVLSADAGMNTSQFCPMNCGDVNGDGLVNSSDALLMLSYDVGLSVPFPLGTGACPASITQPPGCGL